MNYYAGIGSRQTPANILLLMSIVGEYLAKKGYTLRSGGAAGADQAFEKGCARVKGPCEIYLPDKAFKGHPSPYYEISDKAMELAQEYHPRFDNLSPFRRALIARNGYQVLGYDLQTPSDFIVCWTPGGKAEGGTGQALRIAADKDIPILNLAILEDRTKVHQWMTLNLRFLEPIMYDLFS